MYPETGELMVRSVIGFAGLLQLCDFALRNVPLLQPLFRRGRKRSRAGCNSIDSAGAQGLLVLPRQQILLLRGDKIGTVDGEERLALLHILIGGIRKDLADVARKAHLHIGERRSSISTVPVARISSLSCLYSTVPVLTPMLCIRSGVSCTGTSGASIFCSGMDGAGIVRSAGRRTRGHGLNIPGHRHVHRHWLFRPMGAVDPNPMRQLPGSAIQTREVLKNIFVHRSVAPVRVSRWAKAAS